MLLAFLQAYWWAPVVSLGALLMQCTQPRPEIALMLHALTALAWSIPLACLWGQTHTARGEGNDRHANECASQPPTPHASRF